MLLMKPTHKKDCQNKEKYNLKHQGNNYEAAKKSHSKLIQGRLNKKTWRVNVHISVFFVMF